jgi:hypothetical protein
MQSLKHQRSVCMHPHQNPEMARALQQPPPSFQFQQQQFEQLQHMDPRHGPRPVQQPHLGAFLHSRAQSSNSQQPMTSTEGFESDSTIEQVEAKEHPPIAHLGAGPLPLQDIGAGVTGTTVGLLPGRCLKFMKKYLPVRNRYNCTIVWRLSTCLRLTRF